MPQVTIRSHGLSIEVPHGASILEALRRSRIRLETPCNGAGTCGKCKIQLDEEARPNIRMVTNRNLTVEDEREGWILLCSSLVENDVALDLPGLFERGLRILEHGLAIDLPLAPWIGKRFSPEREVTEVWAGPDKLGEDPGDTTEAHLWRGGGYWTPRWSSRSSI